eukprot:SAG31_NODE_8233_length_1493_cov_0.945481_1_plen_160_part_00
MRQPKAGQANHVREKDRCTHRCHLCVHLGSEAPAKANAVPSQTTVLQLCLLPKMQLCYTRVAERDQNVRAATPRVVDSRGLCAASAPHSLVCPRFHAKNLALWPASTLTVPRSAACPAAGRCGLCVRRAAASRLAAASGVWRIRSDRALGASRACMMMS